jgi:hypothetical protein
MIPSFLNLRIPQSWSIDNVLFCQKPTMGPRETLRRLSVDEYWSLLKCAQLLRVFSQFCWRLLRDKRAKEVQQLVQHDLHEELQYKVTQQELRHLRLCELLNGCSVSLNNAQDFETRMVSTYNEDAGVPASVIICPLYPRNEISKKGSLLVLTNALESAWFLHKAGA